MVRGLAIAAFVLIGGVGAADDVASPQPAPKSKVVVSEDSAEVLEAQLETRKAYVKAAEVALAGAKGKLDRVTRARAAGTVAAEEEAQAKLEVETASAQLDIRKAEVREVEVRLKNAKTRPAIAKTAATTIAVFNMAAVMRDYEKAKYEVYVLNKLRVDRSAKLVKLREAFIRLQSQLPLLPEGEAKQNATKELEGLKNRYEAEEKLVNKVLNDEASKIISKLYDEIKEVVDDMAAANSYLVVFAYPDAVSPEERDNPYLKELKLKPPAAQPFFVDKKADITDAVLKKLNSTYPALDENGKKVDVSKLPPIELPGAPKKRD